MVNLSETPDIGACSVNAVTDADNSVAEAWVASDESSKSSWNTYTYTKVASSDTGPPDLWHEFILQ